MYELNQFVINILMNGEYFSSRNQRRVSNQTGKHFWEDGDGPFTVWPQLSAKNLVVPKHSRNPRLYWKYRNDYDGKIAIRSFSSSSSTSSSSSSSSSLKNNVRVEILQTKSAVDIMESCTTEFTSRYFKIVGIYEWIDKKSIKLF
jgi:hypothetical protein